MRWRAMAVAATAGLLVLATASPALAKGPDQASISGPGLTAPIVLGGDGEPGSGEDLGVLSDGSGLFPAVFGPTDLSGLVSSAPIGPLGPKYELTYRVPGGDPTPDTVRQDLYPSAAGGPVTYTEPGQRVFGALTNGGWYHAPDATFAQLLTKLGIPAVTGSVATASPSSGAGTSTQVADRSHTVRWLAIAIGVLACAAVALGLVYRRRSAATRAGT